MQRSLFVILKAAVSEPEPVGVKVTVNVAELLEATDEADEVILKSPALVPEKLMLSILRAPSPELVIVNVSEADEPLVTVPKEVALPPFAIPVIAMSGLVYGEQEPDTPPSIQFDDEPLNEKLLSVPVLLLPLASVKDVTELLLLAEIPSLNL